MTNKDYIEVDGEVKGTLPNALFRVLLSDPFNKEIVCHVSGKIRKNFINILPGDQVKVAVSLIDPTKGRIIFRTRR